MRPTLDQIVANKREEVARRRRTARVAEFARNVVPAKGTFLSNFADEHINLIAEIKPKSPSAGQLACADLNLLQVAHTYSKYAKAISVLTDTQFFGGDFKVLQQVAQSVNVPTLCKDFIIDACQVLDARAAGAEAVLLIVKILTDDQLAALFSAIEELNMVALVEVQNEEEMSRANRLKPRAILINNRDLSTFDIDLGTTQRLAPLAHEAAKVIAASGVETSADIQQILPSTNSFLVGSSLMKSSNLEQKLQELTGVVLCQP